MDVYNIQSIQRHVADLSLESTPRYMIEKERSHSREEKDTLLVKHIASSNTWCTGKAEL
jgi:hypothetical protein